MVSTFNLRESRLPEVSYESNEQQWSFSPDTLQAAVCKALSKIDRFSAVFPLFKRQTSVCGRMSHGQSRTSETDHRPPRDKSPRVLRCQRLLCRVLATRCERHSLGMVLFLRRWGVEMIDTGSVSDRRFVDQMQLQ
jgi:hypothetical protein